MEINYLLNGNVVDDLPIALESDIELDSGIMHKVAVQFDKFITFILKLVQTVIGNVKRMFTKASSKFNTVSKNLVIVDTYGYVEASSAAYVLINEYYNVLIELNALDHIINQSAGLMDDVKDKLKSSTIGSITKKPSARDNYEKVTLKLTKADQLKEALQTLLANTKKSIPVTRPMRYSKEYIKREMNTKYSEITKLLKDLEFQLKNAQATYKTRNFMYRRWHKEDITRNQNMLNHTTGLIALTNEFQNFYFLVMSQVNADNGVIIKYAEDGSPALV